MNLLDKVMNRQLGPMMTGSIMAIINGNVREKFGIESDRWSCIYPDWEDKNIYMVELDREEKSVTLDECDEECYEQQSLQKYLYFPEDDLIELEKFLTL